LRSTLRRTTWCLALSLASLASVAFPGAPALGQASPVGHLLDLINQDRAQHGIGPVSLDASLSVIAQVQANAMAAARRIFQNPAFPNNVPTANSAGENVGYGPDADQVHTAFVASPEHQVIIVGADYHLVGIAVANSPIGLMVVEDFVDTTGGLVIALPPLRLLKPPTPKPAPPPVVAAAPVAPPKPAGPPPPKPAVPAPPPVPVVVPTPTPSPQPPPPPPPPSFDKALYARMLEWEQWQMGTSTGH